MRFCLDQLVRRNLAGVWVRGTLPDGPAVWTANHHSWWDFFAAHAALRAAGRSDIGVLMDPRTISSRPAYAWAGVVGSDRLRTAETLLQSGSVLIVFPEGELRRPNGLGPLRPGARWLAARTGVPLLAVATRVVLRGQQAPEAYLDVCLVGDDADLGTVLGGRLAALDDELAVAEPEPPVPGFRLAVGGSPSWSDRIRR